MSSDEDTGSVGQISEFETQFVPRSNDDEVLYEVVEITAERAKQYKVRWAGVDPVTGRPWPQDWVDKHDCTHELVAEWKAKKAQKKRGGVRKQVTSTKSRASISSKTSGSSSSRKKRPPVASGQISHESSSDERSVRVATASPAKRKRRSESTVVGSVGDQQTAEQDDPPRPRKKRKTAVEVLLHADENGIRHSETEAQPKTGRRELSGRHLNSESEAEAAISPPFKVGPPRGVQRQGRSSKSKKAASDSPGRIHTSTSSAQQQLPAGQGTAPQKTRAPHRSTDSSPSPPPSKLKRKTKNETSGEGSPSKDKLLSPQTERPRVSIPPSSIRRRSPELSPGARARLEIFDRMMAESPEPHAANRSFPGDVREQDFEFEDLYAPPPSSPPPSATHFRSKPKVVSDVSNGIVPETESSQSQSRALSKAALRGNQATTSPHHSPPKTNSNVGPGFGSHSPTRPEQHLDLPEIAVISALSSSSISPISPVDITVPVQAKKAAQVTRSHTKPVYKPVPQISPETFRLKVKPLQCVARDAEVDAPASSIESFPSPQKGKGKRRAIDDDDALESSDNDKRITRLTDSGIKNRGQELFDQLQRTREVQRAKAKTKRTKNVDDIVKGQNSSKPASKRKSHADLLPITSDENHLQAGGQEMEDAFVDPTGGDNSATLDTQDVSKKIPLTEQAKDLLRIQLRQEEEESTQEALQGWPKPDPQKDDIQGHGPGDVEIPEATSPSKESNQQDVDHLQLASVIVQASQGQRPEDPDVEVLAMEHSASSPARVIPDNLSDPPKRRLDEALSLLNVKSEEIQRLTGELAMERDTINGLQQEFTRLEESLAEERSLRQAETVAREAERVQWSGDRTKWEEERVQWQNDSVSWEHRLAEWTEERASLSNRIDVLSDVTRKAEEEKSKWDLQRGEWDAERAKWDLERETWLESRKNMEKERAVLEQQLAVLKTHRAAYDQDRDNWSATQAQWTADMTRWEDERTKWEVDRAALIEEREVLSKSASALTSSVESLTVAKTSAERDAEFFRDQYAQASGYVTSVRAENVELEKQAKVSRGQAEEGVATIKVLFENRVKALQDDVSRWKALAELLQEKDQKTNDEIRLRAAREPELEQRCRKLTSDKESLETDLRRLGQAHQRVGVQRNKLYREVIALKRQRAVLRSKLKKAIASQETSNSAPEEQLTSQLVDPSSIDPNDMDLIPDCFPAKVEANDDDAWYPCMWRPQSDLCQQNFDSKEDLERHLQEHFRE